MVLVCLPVSRAVRLGEHVDIATWLRSRTSELFASLHILGVYIVGLTAPGRSTHSICGRKSSTAIIRTSSFFAATFIAMSVNTAANKMLMVVMVVGGGRYKTVKKVREYYYRTTNVHLKCREAN